MSTPPVAPAEVAPVVGLSDRDQGWDVETFFAVHSFDAESESLSSVATDSFFRRFLDAPESSGSR